MDVADDCVFCTWRLLRTVCFVDEGCDVLLEVADDCVLLQMGVAEDCVLCRWRLWCAVGGC